MVDKTQFLHKKVTMVKSAMIGGTFYSRGEDVGFVPEVAETLIEKKIAVAFGAPEGNAARSAAGLLPASERYATVADAASRTAGGGKK